VIKLRTKQHMHLCTISRILHMVNATFTIFCTFPVILQCNSCEYPLLYWQRKSQPILKCYGISRFWSWKIVKTCHRAIYLRIWKLWTYSVCLKNSEKQCRQRYTNSIILTTTLMLTWDQLKNSLTHTDEYCLCAHNVQYVFIKLVWPVNTV